MKKSLGIVISLWAAAAVQPAWAASAQGAASPEDALSQCVVMRTNGADRLLTAQWMFAAMSRSPQIADLAKVPDQRKAELDKGFSALVTRLVMKDCYEQVRPVAAKDFEGAFRLAGESLGKVAMQELLGNPAVDKAIGEYTSYLSEEDFKPLIDSIGASQSK